MDYIYCLEALLSAPNPPTNYALTKGDVANIAHCYNWQGRWQEGEWETVADMIREDPEPFLNDVSTYYEGSGPDRYYDYRRPDGRRK